VLKITAWREMGTRGVRGSLAALSPTSGLGSQTADLSRTHHT
jgi:hypothetical protein